jgi:hypothetical protein
VPASCAGSRACQSCSRPRAGRSSNHVSCSVGQAWRVTDGVRPAPFGATIRISLERIAMTLTRSTPQMRVSPVGLSLPAC